jgi:hypothetical protein
MYMVCRRCDYVLRSCREFLNHRDSVYSIVELAQAY